MRNNTNDSISIIISTFKVLSGPLLIIASSDLNYTEVNVDKEFAQFRTVFYEEFKSSIGKIKALNSLEYHLNNGLGHEMVSRSEYYCDEENKFHWSNLVKYKVEISFPPKDDDYWSQGRTGEDFEDHEVSGFDEQTEQLVFRLLDKIKLKFSEFKHLVEAQINDIDKEPDKDYKHLRSDIRELDVHPSKENAKEIQLEDDPIKSEIEEFISMFDTLDGNTKWEYAFRNIEDVKVFSKILTYHFKGLDYVKLDAPIQMVPKCKTKLAHLLRDIHKQKTNIQVLKKDEKFFTLLKDSISVFNGHTEQQICRMLSR